MQLKVILCKFGQICATRNVLMLLETRSVEQEMLLCSWKQFDVYLDRSVQQDILLSDWKQFYTSMDRSVQQKIVMSSWNQIYTSVGKNSILKIEMEFLPTDR